MPPTLFSSSIQDNLLFAICDPFLYAIGPDGVINKLAHERLTYSIIESFVNTVDSSNLVDTVNYFDSQARHIQLLKFEKILGGKFSRIAVVMKASQPYIYHNLALALLLDTESQGYSSFSLNGTLLKKYLTQRPKKLPRTGVISGSLI